MNFVWPLLHDLQLRVLPLLAAKEKYQAFWYWQEQDKAKHLLAILHAARFSYGRTAAGKLFSTATATAAAAYAATAAASVASTKINNFKNITQSDLIFLQTSTQSLL